MSRLFSINMRHLANPFRLRRPRPDRGFSLEFQKDSGTTCSRCGFLVPAGNSYCGKCGAPVSRTRHSTSSGIELEGGSQSSIAYPPYQQKYTMIQRLTKLVTSPREAMKDIGRAPDYEGVVVLLTMWIVFGIATGVVMANKIHFVGPYGNEATSMFYTGVSIGLILVPFLTIARWLVKSLLIQFSCDRSNWEFKTAASVTGYAYLPNVVFSFAWIFVISSLVPSITLDTADLESALIQIQQYDAQTSWLTVGVSLMVALLALLWKSYLGGLGAHAGTHEAISESHGIMWFLFIGFIGILVDFTGII
jgi:hypothetical protein